MRQASFPLLDEYFNGRKTGDTECAKGAGRKRRVARLWLRMQSLANPVFSDLDDYLSTKLGGASESHVDAYEGNDERPPHFGFRWGPDGQRLNVFMLTGSPDTGELHATWRCWRDGIPFDGHRMIDTSTSTECVIAILQELILQFPPV